VNREKVLNQNVEYLIGGKDDIYFYFVKWKYGIETSNENCSNVNNERRNIKVTDNSCWLLDNRLFLF